MPRSKKEVPGFKPSAPEKTPLERPQPLPSEKPIQPNEHPLPAPSPTPPKDVPEPTPAEQPLQPPGERPEHNPEELPGKMPGPPAPLLVLISMAFLGVLIGCAHAPAVVAAPPATTQGACQQVRDFFKTQHAESDASEEMSAGCHMNINASDRVSGLLDRRLESQGWTRDPAYAKGSVPNAVFYQTPNTRCAITQMVDTSSANSHVTGGIGVGGGSHMSTGFGIGLGLGSGDDVRVDYKIDCLPK